MIDHPEYTLSLPPSCPRNQDHLTGTRGRRIRGHQKAGPCHPLGGRSQLTNVRHWAGERALRAPFEPLQPGTPSASGRGSNPSPPLGSGPVRTRHLRRPLSQPAAVGVRVVEIMTRLALPAIHQG